MSTWAPIEVGGVYAFSSLRTVGTLLGLSARTIFCELEGNLKKILGSSVLPKISSLKAHKNINMSKKFTDGYCAQLGSIEKTCQ